jgi:nucleoside-diphosphate-sugar epimerase
MRVLVIGGTGFIGPYVVDRLAQAGHDVAVLHRGETEAATAPHVRRIPGDRRRLAESAAAIRTFAPEVVVDLILSSGAQARGLLQVCRPFARRIVAASSMDVYRAAGVLHGTEPGPLEPLPLTEESPLRSTSRTYPPQQIARLKQVFGWLDDEYDKVAVEREVTGDPTLPGTVLRLPMIFGPGDRLHRLFAILKQADEGRPVILLDERLAHWRSPRGYVENVAAAIALAATDDRAAGRTYNVADTKSFSELEWARLVATEAGWSGELRAVPPEQLPEAQRARGNLAQDWVADSARIRRELAYREPIARDEAIRRTITWERKNPPRA